MAEPPTKRRKIRKGTHSCWECRRRKVKCIFENPEDAVCKPCVARDTSCVSQEELAFPVPTPEGGLSQRLGRLERMVGQVLEQAMVQPQSPAGRRTMSSPSDTQSSRGESHEAPVIVSSLPATLSQYHEAGSHLFDLPGSEDARRVTGVAANNSYARDLQEQLLRLQSARHDSSSPWAQYAGISQHLHSLFPPRETLEVLAYQSPGAAHVLAVFSTKNDPAVNTPELPSVLTNVPPATSHPALLAKRLVQLALCLQQLPTTIDASKLRFSPAGGGTGSARAAAEVWITAASSLVTGNDALVGCLESIECLLFQTFFRLGAGQLRKAWMDSRRALTTAQLLGIDRSARHAAGRHIPSCDPARELKYRPRPDAVWFRLNCSDRYLSLMLGLPIGSRDNSFAAAEITAQDTPEIRLGKAYSVITGKLAERNDAADAGNTAEAYAITQALDLDLERAARVMKGTWWQVPNISAQDLDNGGGRCLSVGLCQQPSGPAGTTDETIAAAMTLQTQVRHYLLLILVHLPYLLREREGRRYEYNRTTCMQASRAVVERFLAYRDVFKLAVAGRPVDYAALIAAATLLLGHLPRRREEGDLGAEDNEAERDSDRALAEALRHKLCELAALNSDRTMAEAAETIAHLLPLAMRNTGEPEQASVSAAFLAGVEANTSRSGVAFPDYSQAEDPSMLLTYGVPKAFPIAQGKCALMDSRYPQSDIGGPVDFNLDDSGLQGIEMVYWSMVRSGMT
ncbi:Transcription factor sdnS [Paramyrothecium foliicola]|nr:Transcription factor sdnS [Paramyrothecium foliicola]